MLDVPALTDCEPVSGVIWIVYEGVVFTVVTPEPVGPPVADAVRVTVPVVPLVETE